MKRSYLNEVCKLSGVTINPGIRGSLKESVPVIGYVNGKQNMEYGEAVKGDLFHSISEYDEKIRSIAVYVDAEDEEYVDEEDPNRMKIMVIPNDPRKKDIQVTFDISFCPHAGGFPSITNVKINGMTAVRLGDVMVAEMEDPYEIDDAIKVAVDAARNHPSMAYLKGRSVTGDWNLDK